MICTVEPQLSGPTYLDSHDQSTKIWEGMLYVGVVTALLGYLKFKYVFFMIFCGILYTVSEDL